MKINFIMPGLGDSGGIKVVRKYVSMMSEKGIDVIIYSPVKAYNLYRYKSKLKNKIHQFYCTIKNVYTFMKNEKREIKWVWSVNNHTIRNADVVIATTWATAYDVAAMNKKKGEKYYFIQGFEIWDNYKLGIKSYELPLRKIVVSSWINKQLKDNLNIGPFPVVYNGINLDKFYNENKVFKQKNEKKQFLMLNHVLETKGVSYGIQVFERVREKYPEIKIKMFGMCSNNNLPDYVEYIYMPSPDTLKKLYCESDIFIFPSLEEGWGLTPIEAMACECAVVGTNTGFVLDLGRHGENMLISNPKDVEGMVNNICELMENPKKLERISIEGRQTVNELSWDKACEKFTCLLRG